MRRVSGGTEVGKMVQENGENNNDLSKILPGSYYACRYDTEWYFCMVNYVSFEHLDVNVKFLYPNGPAFKFFCPHRDDTCWIPVNDMICQVEPPSSGSTGRFYSFLDSDINHGGSC